MYVTARTLARQRVNLKTNVQRARATTHQGSFVIEPTQYEGAEKGSWQIVGLLHAVAQKPCQFLLGGVQKFDDHRLSLLYLHYPVRLYF